MKIVQRTLGVYLWVYVTMLKYHLRSIKKVGDFLYYDKTFEISPKGDELLRVMPVKTDMRT